MRGASPVERLKGQIGDALLSRAEFAARRPGCRAGIYDHLAEIVSRATSAARTPSRKDLLGMVQTLKVYEAVLSETDRITTRELFYRAPALFVSQRKVVSLVRAVSSRLSAEPADLNIVSALKGMFCGRVSFTYRDSECALEGVSLIPHMRDVCKVSTPARAVVVLEKEAAFSLISAAASTLEDRLGGPVLLVTGKGYPCWNTLRFLSLLDAPRIFGVFDFDPHGFMIYKVYKAGSRARPSLFVDRIERIGLAKEDIALASLPPTAKLPLSERDSSALDSLLSSPFFNSPAETLSLNDLVLMREAELKLEMEAVLVDSAHWVSYLSRRIGVAAEVGMGIEPRLHKEKAKARTEA